MPGKPTIPHLRGYTRHWRVDCDNGAPTCIKCRDVWCNNQVHYSAASISGNTEARTAGNHARRCQWMSRTKDATVPGRLPLSNWKDENMHLPTLNIADDASSSVRPPINLVKLQQILNSARELFFRNGFSATSMEAVAKEARVGKATLYENFPNKIELLRAIIEIELEMRAEHLIFEPVAVDHLRNTLARFSHALMELLLSPANVAIYRIISAEAPRHPEIGRLFYENGPSRLINRVAEFMTNLMETGKIHYGNPRLIATQFIGLIRADMQTRSLFGIDDEALKTERFLIVESGVDAFLRAFAR